MEMSRFLRTVAACLILVLLTVLSVGAWPMEKPHRIQKRTIFQLCGLIQHYTSRSCLDFNGYGCFCGLGNAGKKPVDRVDACCKKHDDCYGNVACWWFYPQWVGYQIDCSQDVCLCQDDNPCARSVCECDLELAECMAESEYHASYLGYDRDLCQHQPRLHPS